MCNVFFGIASNMVQYKPCGVLYHTSHIMYHFPCQDEAISDALVHGLECASRVNHATRTIEPLIAYLQHAPAMNQTEAYGSLRAILNNQASAKDTRDSVVLEWMRHVVRHKLHLLFSDMVVVFNTLWHNMVSHITRHTSSHIVTCHMEYMDQCNVCHVIPIGPYTAHLTFHMKLHLT